MSSLIFMNEHLKDGSGKPPITIKHHTGRIENCREVRIFLGTIKVPKKPKNIAEHIVHAYVECKGALDFLVIK